MYFIDVHFIVWYILDLELLGAFPLIKDCMETNVPLYMTFVQPFLAIFSPYVC